MYLKGWPQYFHENNHMLVEDPQTDVSVSLKLNIPTQNFLPYLGV